MKSESDFISDGKELGYDGQRLIDYTRYRVKQEQDQEESNRVFERELREVETRKAEHEARKAENEARRIEAEIELTRLRIVNPNVPPLVPIGTRADQGARSQIKLAQFQEGGDISVYLNMFERVRQSNDWSERTAVSALFNGFAGTSVSLFLDKVPNDIDYDDLKDQLIKCFGPSIYNYFYKFRNSKQEGESFRQFVMKIQDYFSNIVKIADIEDRNTLIDLIVKDQILRSVDRSLCEHLKEKNIFRSSLDEVIDFGDNFQSVHGRPDKSKFKNRFDNYAKKTSYDNDSNLTNNASSGRPNLNADKRTNYVCFRCNESGHVAKYCKKNFASYASEKEKITCFKCNEIGHVSRKCPLKTKWNLKSSINVGVAVKSSCEYSRKLPVVLGTVNGKKVKILRDTGCTAVIVKKSLVPNENLTNSSSVLNFADMRSLKAPKAIIDLKCPLFSGKTEAVCLDDLPFDVLLGNIENASCACKITEEHVVNDYNSVCAVETRNSIIKYSKPLKETNISNLPFQFDIKSVNNKDLITLQENDPTLKSCFKKLNSLDNCFPKFAKHNGILVRLCNRGKSSKDIVQQIVLPLELRDKFIKLGHDALLAGHLGIRKTKDRILSHYFGLAVTMTSSDIVNRAVCVNDMQFLNLLKYL